MVFLPIILTLKFCWWLRQLGSCWKWSPLHNYCTKKYRKPSKETLFVPGPFFSQAGLFCCETYLHGLTHFNVSLLQFKYALWSCISEKQNLKSINKIKILKKINSSDSVSADTRVPGPVPGFLYCILLFHKFCIILSQNCAFLQKNKSMSFKRLSVCYIYMCVIYKLCVCACVEQFAARRNQPLSWS